FTVKINRKETAILKDVYKEYSVFNDENLKKAYIRGIFLGSGSINNPQNKYHIEMILRDEKIAKELILTLKQFNINFKLLYLNAKNKVSIYSKDGEEISKFLAFIGANSAVIKFEEIRVYRDMRNNVNRLVNCE